jgi:hypothetical protein
VEHCIATASGSAALLVALEALDPECERAHAEVVTFHHRLLLGDDRDMDDVIRAFHKVWEHPT